MIVETGERAESSNQPAVHVPHYSMKREPPTGLWSVFRVTSCMMKSVSVQSEARRAAAISVSLTLFPAKTVNTGDRYSTYPNSATKLNLSKSGLVNPVLPLGSSRLYIRILLSGGSLTTVPRRKLNYVESRLRTSFYSPPSILHARGYFWSTEPLFPFLSTRRFHPRLVFSGVSSPKNRNRPFVPNPELGLTLSPSTRLSSLKRFLLRDRHRWIVLREATAPSFFSRPVIASYASSYRILGVTFF